ncbi:MAG: hypothetical protein HPZ91_06760 [Lentisphaeria bacterium]|nr:hypothetical protein [Lentisphaeria bacterium]
MRLNHQLLRAFCGYWTPEVMRSELSINYKYQSKDLYYSERYAIGVFACSGYEKLKGECEKYNIKNQN